MTSTREAGADVVLDVVFEDGLLYLELVNLGQQPALDVSCQFDQPLIGVGGGEIGRQALFRHLPFLMAGRRIRTLLDTSAAYFASNQPTRFAATVIYHERDQTPRRTTVEHDLEIYRDLVYVLQ